MRKTKHHRLAIRETLLPGQLLQLSDNAAHYLTHVVRLGVGMGLSVFNGQQGEFAATIGHIGKRAVGIVVGQQLRLPEQPVGLTVCFAPIKGGRMETIIEKATELGADYLQPVITQRTIVDKVNVERAEAIAREAAEQCERIGWPEIREPVELSMLLGNWPIDRPLVYGDESGVGMPITSLPCFARNDGWGILVGPEGGFTPEEFVALKKVKSAHGVSLGPRILRADTAIITLCAATLMAWGDWHLAPRRQGSPA